MSSFKNQEGAVIVDRMIAAIRENKQYLSDIDGAIGDGDHGINMNKGFTLAGEALEKDPGDLAHGLNILGRILIMKIGGAMGPLYGKIFKTMGSTFSGRDEIDAGLFREALNQVGQAMEKLSPARVGDKTLVDALYPAIEAYNRSLDEGGGFREALETMKAAAASGRDSTSGMIAKIGRSSRLGERSRGVTDAGAASCALLLGVMADSITDLL
ncbi:MAG TPA: dihydroxyacetone kinase subunit L [Bacteroides sp.]|nr:dihydroxyacetone kinase subunit L [Bacteroides sp.]